MCKNGCTDQDDVWGEHSGGPWNILLDVGSDPPQRGEGIDPLLNVETPAIFGMAEARDLKFCVPTESWGH